MEETNDPRPIQLSPARDTGRCGQAALDAGRRSAPPCRRPQSGPDDEAPARHSRTSRRSAWHRRPEGHPPRGQSHRDRRDDHAARAAGFRRNRKIAADPARYRGTIGGNVANGDPGNDMPALMLTLDASYRLEGASGAREVAAGEFYQGAYFTALEPGEILTSISIPAPSAGHGYAYEKLKRKVGDYATAAAAVVLTMAGGKVA